MTELQDSRAWLKPITDRLWRLLSSGAGISLIGLYLGVMSQYGMHFLLARELGAATYGYIALALNIISILDMVAQLGFSHGIVKLIGVYTSKNEPGLLIGAIQGVFGLTLICGLSIALVGGAVVYFLPFSDHEMFLTLEAAFFSVPALGLLLLVQNMARGFKKMGYATMPQAVFLPVLVLLVTLWMLWSNRGLRAYWIVSCYGAVALVLALSVYWRILSQKEMAFIRAHKPQYRIREWLSMSLPMLASVSLFQVLQRSDLLILALFVPAKSVGTYALASRLAQAVAVSNTAFNRYWASSMASQHALQDSRKFQNVVTKTARLTFFCSLSLSLLLLSFGKRVIGLFGGEFQEVYGLMAVLLVGQIVSAYFAPNVTLLQMADKERVVTGIHFISCVCVVGGYFLFVPHFGVMGAAVMTSAGFVLLNLMAAFAGWKLLRCYSGAF